MDRRGLYIALGLAGFFGLLFAFFPQLDLILARQHFDPDLRAFPMSGIWEAELLRRAAMWISWGIALPAFVALVVKLIWPQWPLIMSGRSMLFIIVTILLSAGVFSNFLFKGHWNRPRPVATQELGGALAFKPWWDPRGNCPRNCSFYSGEASTAFWTYAPAALAPPAVRPIAYAAATAFGLATGYWRMTFGGHYATDVIFAGIFTFIIVWLVYNAMFRWWPKRFDDAAIDHALGNAVMALRRSFMQPDRPSRAGEPLPRSFWWLLIALGGLTAFRLVGLKLSEVELFFDESQYWVWSLTPAFGYFSKPPLLAWIIGEAGRVCGDSEACIRGPAPLFYFGTSIVVYFIARALYDTRVAFWAALCLALAPGLIFSSRIISTDVPLLFCWALALLAFIRLVDDPAGPLSRRWAIVLGLSIGFGMLAKYAMAYFFLGIALAAVFDAPTRALLRQRSFLTAVAISLAVLVPNILWNVFNGFVTLRHTGDNIEGGGVRFSAINGLEFIASQFAVFGPVIFAVFLLALLWRLHHRSERADNIMIAFALPPLVLVAITAFITKANANWAAPAAISLTIVAVAILVRRAQWRWLYAIVVLGLMVQIVLPLADANANRISLPFIKNPDIYARTVGWNALAREVERAARENGARAVAADRRDIVASLVYYLRRSGLEVKSWPAGDSPAHSFDMDRPLNAQTPQPVLYGTWCALPRRLLAHFDSVEVLPPVSAPSGPNSRRQLYLFKLSKYHGDGSPLGPCVP